MDYCAAYYKEIIKKYGSMFATETVGVHGLMGPTLFPLVHVSPQRRHSSSSSAFSLSRSCLSVSLPHTPAHTTTPCVTSKNVELWV